MILYRVKLDRAVNILEKIKIKVKKMKNLNFFLKQLQLATTCILVSFDWFFFAIHHHNSLH